MEIHIIPGTWNFAPPEPLLLASLREFPEVYCSSMAQFQVGLLPPQGGIPTIVRQTLVFGFMVELITLDELSIEDTINVR